MELHLLICSFENRTNIFHNFRHGPDAVNSPQGREMEMGGPLYKEEEYLQFFGPGEFPFMQFYVVRIGNQDYSFWNIAR